MIDTIVVSLMCLFCLALGFVFGAWWSGCKPHKDIADE